MLGVEGRTSDVGVDRYDLCRREKRRCLGRREKLESRKVRLWREVPARRATCWSVGLREAWEKIAGTL